MKIFSFFLSAIALMASDVKGQQFDACPANITGFLSCQDACGGPGVPLNFVVFPSSFTGADNSTGYDYAGFDCECAESDPPVVCSYTYSFPTCEEVGVTNCNNPPTTCDEYCNSLSLIDGNSSGSCTRNEAVSPPWTSCQCPAPFLEPGSETPGSELYVCGDPGYQDGSGATAVLGSFALAVAIGASAIAAMS